MFTMLRGEVIGNLIKVRFILKRKKFHKGFSREKGVLQKTK